MTSRLQSALVILVVVDGLGWALGVLAPLFYALRRGALPRVAGIRLLSGPFEAFGLQGVMTAGLLFVVVSAFKLLAAHWLWRSRQDGAILELILLGLSALFWYGFALPFGPLVGLPQLVLLALVWSQLQ